MQNSRFQIGEEVSLNETYFLEGKAYFSGNLKSFKGSRKVKNISYCERDKLGNTAHYLIELEGSKEPRLLHERFLKNN
jgi:hypothetical protein